LTTFEIIVLTVLFFAAAVLYSSVGHAGSSGYQAAMALVGVAPAVMKPTALSLNILVATIATVQFYRAGCFSWRVFWPFAAASVSAAYLGGLIKLPDAYFKALVGCVLFYAAWRLLAAKPRQSELPSRPPSIPICLLIGAALGVLSGLTGTGGGIFLSPLLLLFGWADVRTTMGVSAPFVLVNSISGLTGLLQTAQPWPEAIPIWGATVVCGGLIGAHYGSRRLPGNALRRLLGVVLVIAGIKMINEGLFRKPSEEAKPPVTGQYAPP